MKYISLCLLIVLASCSSDIFEEDPPYDIDAVPVEEISTFNSDFAYDKPIGFIPQGYENLAENKQTIPKTHPQPKSNVAAKKEQLTKMLPKLYAKDCIKQDLFLSAKSISSLYKVYLKDNKTCQKITKPKINSHFVSILIQYYDRQAIRILNADPEFLQIYMSAINGASKPIKVALNRKMMENGCNFLSVDACASIKKALF